MVFVEDVTVCLWKKYADKKDVRENKEYMQELYRCSDCIAKPPNVCPNYLSNVRLDLVNGDYR